MMRALRVPNAAGREERGGRKDIRSLSDSGTFIPRRIHFPFFASSCVSEDDIVEFITLEEEGGASTSKHFLPGHQKTSKPCL